MIILQTERLNLRQLTIDDGEFIVELLNQPSFIQNIGDRGVRTLDDAHQYILTGPVASYEKFGFGLYLVELRESATAIGLCGLLKREALDDVDIGYAYLPAHWGKGYAFEAASAVLNYGKNMHGLNRVVAVVSPDNYGSIKVLEKLGLKFERMVQLVDGEAEVKLFA
ncbi:MAG: GNAT family N-acetyltransferase [Acidobacteriota bacterium]